MTKEIIDTANIKFRPLRADEIEVRQGSAGSGYIDLLLYKTSRTDVDLLNETVGNKNWTNEMRVIDGNLWAGIGIWNDERKDYTWKWSVGTESNVEKIKGEDSDSFKRAGYRWGIGSELYSSPRIRVWAIAEVNGEKVQKYTPKKDGKGTWDSFKVASIEYDGLGNITKLSIVNNDTGKVVYSYGYSDSKEIIDAVKETRTRKQEIIDALKNQES